MANQEYSNVDFWLKLLAEDDSDNDKKDHWKMCLFSKIRHIKAFFAQQYTQNVTKAIMKQTAKEGLAIHGKRSRLGGGWGNRYIIPVLKVQINGERIDIDYSGIQNQVREVNLPDECI